ncbi:hypothetical protein DFP92_1101, partial [Yoonia sediminilitoris]
CSVVVKCPASNAPENDADNVTNTIKMARISTIEIGLNGVHVELQVIR